MPRIELPSGGWADLRDPATLRVRDKQQYCLSVEGKDGWAFSFAVRDSQLRLAVMSWSFAMPVPSENIESVLDLDPRDCTAIQQWFVENADPVLFPRDPDDEDDELDPKAEQRN